MFLFHHLLFAAALLLTLPAGAHSPFAASARQVAPTAEEAAGLTPTAIGNRLGRCRVAESLAYLEALVAHDPLPPVVWGAPGEPAPASDVPLGQSALARGMATAPLAVPVPRAHISPRSRAAKFQAEPYVAVLGSGYFGMFEHLGFLRAQERLGLVPTATLGISSGAITAALASCTSLAEAERALLTTSLADFADVTFAALRGGAWFAGDALGRKIDRLVMPYGITRLEQCRRPVAVAAYSLERQQTICFSTGPIGRAVQASAALPKLFLPAVYEDGEHYIDGGFVDPHGVTLIAPGALALIHRPLGLSTDAGPTSAAAAHVARPQSFEALSPDPAHVTFALDNPDRFAKWDIFWQLDWDKAKLRRIINQHEACALSWWLSEAPLAAEGEPTTLALQY